MNDKRTDNHYHENQQNFRDALTYTEAGSEFSARLIEKDYYCSLVLQDLAALFEQGLVFKGGTCLSKVHAEFFRLSEDLDFAISLRPDAARSERRRMVTPVREHLVLLPSRFSCFEVMDAITGHDNSRQYSGRLAYRSVLTGERDFIKIDVSLREETVLQTEVLAARTLLRDPHVDKPALALVSVRTLGVLEVYAEKIRAALTRRDPAIRDFFDIHHAVGKPPFDPRSQALLEVVAKKLAVRGNDPVDLSPEKRLALEGQLETQLRPVLRDRDYRAFDLPSVFAVLEEMSRLCSP